MKTLLSILFFLAGITCVQAQGFAVTGTVQSAQSKETLPGASVLLTRLADSVKTATGTDKDGNFRFASVKPGQYSVLVNYIGHKSFTKLLTVQNASVNLGQLMVEESSTTIKEVEVVGQIPLGTQKGDTTVFNAAAFKVADDASAEDLVTKLPGVTIVDGKIQAQGEEVRQVLVDGKRFFGEDANTALRNLPAEVIENIEIFDKRSDQAEFSGFDDGNRAKTINIVTKQNRRQGQFGKVSVGAGPGEKEIFGSDMKYMAGASVNIFKGNRRLTVNGLTNNINMQDFSVGEAPGGGMRGRRGGGGGGNAGGGGGGSGISTTNTFGLNYTDQWGKKMEVSGNYNYSNSRNVNNTKSFTDYFTSEKSVFYERQDYSTGFNNNNNESHQFNFRLEYNINERNRLLISPRLSLQNSRSVNRRNSRSLFDSDPNTEEVDEATINEIANSSKSDGLSYSLNNNINFSHRFDKPGRTVTAGISTSNSINDANSYRDNLSINYRDRKGFAYETPRFVPQNQHIKTDRNGLTWRGNVALSERVGEKARVQADYSISNRFEDSDRIVYDWMGSLETGNYGSKNDSLSNVYQSEYLTQAAKTSYQYNSEKIRFQVETQYQFANLQNEQEFPRPYKLNQTFHNFLPTAQVEYKFSKTKNIQLDYRTSTDAPSVTQLQDVIDNTSQQRIRTGNPNLVQAYQNSINLRYRSFATETNKVFSFFVTAMKTDDYITNSTTEIDENLGRELDARGIEYGSGAQFVRPVNLDGNWSTRSFLSYGQPLNFIKSNFNISASIGYNRTPGLLQNDLFFTNSTTIGFGGSLTSNISQNVDFNLSTNSNKRFIGSTLIDPETGERTMNESFNQSTQLRANFRFWKGVVYRTEFSHQLNTGLSSSLNTNYTLLNMSISKKVLKSQKGELSLSVNDLLRQNVSIQRNVNENFIQDSQSDVLQRFFMLTFSYNIRNFAGGAPGGRGTGERAPGERGNFRQGGEGGQGGGFERQGGGGRNRAF